MGAILDEIRSSGIVRNGTGREKKAHSFIPAEEGAFIEKIIDETGARVAVEVGLAYGVSALHISSALNRNNGTAHYIIDPKQNDPDIWDGIGLLNLEREGYLKHVKFFDEPSYLSLPKLVEMEVKADFAFIDGWHTFDHTLIDFFYIDLLLRPGGVVVLDDANWGAIRKVISFIAANRHYTIISPRKMRFFKVLKHLQYDLRKGLITLEEFMAYLIKPGIYKASLLKFVALRKEKDDDRKWDHFRPFV